MDKYLLDILKEVKTIIIPGLGALTITNAATGEIMFMPYLKYDDGTLSKFISEKESISENDAKNLIAKYVRDVEAVINVGNSYDMYQFGSFKKNADGDVEFLQYLGNEEPNEENNAQLIPEETKSSIEEIEEKAQKIVEEEEEEEAEPESDEPSILPIVEPVTEEIREEKTPEPEAEEKTLSDTKSPENLEIVPPKNETPSETGSKEEYTEEQQWKDDLDLPPLNAKKERPKKPILEKTQKDKKKRSPLFYFLIVFGVLVVCGTLTVAMFYKSFEKMFPFMSEHTREKVETPKESETEIKDTTSEQEEMVTESTMEENTEEVESEQTEKKEPVTVEEKTTANSNMSSGDIIQTSTGQVDRNKPFHIIGGAFTDQANAERYQKRLIDSGNQSVIIGRFDKLFIVSIGSYVSNEEAQQALNSSRSVSSKAWIFKWP